jgi:hypothetical protein
MKCIDYLRNIIKKKKKKNVGTPVYIYTYIARKCLILVWTVILFRIYCEYLNITQAFL